MNTRNVGGVCAVLLGLSACASSVHGASPQGPKPLAAQEPQKIAPTVKELAAEGESAFSAQDWPVAIARFERVTELEPANLRAWMRLGYSRHMQRDYAKAIEAYSKIQSGPGLATARYNIACAQALLGKTDDAFAALNSAVDAGFTDAKTFDGDSDLASLRADPRFAKVSARVSAAASNAQGKANGFQPPPEARQFDFWVGEWDVFAAGGGRAGSSKVESILGGCVILENWTSAQGNQGKSFNRYDPRKAEWRQHWVDDSGNEVNFAGTFADGCMSVVAKTPAPDGSTHLRRMRFFDLPGDDVRQWGEVSKDGGATWATEYDLLYRPKSAKPADKAAGGQ